MYFIFKNKLNDFNYSLKKSPFKMSRFCRICHGFAQSWNFAWKICQQLHFHELHSHDYSVPWPKAPCYLCKIGSERNMTPIELFGRFEKKSKNYSTYFFEPLWSLRNPSKKWPRNQPNTYLYFFLRSFSKVNEIIP